MKKTFSVIVSILALAGSAHAAIVFDYQADPQVTADFYQPEVTGAFLTGQTFNGNTWSVSLSFTVTEAVTVDSIVLNLFTFSGANAVQNSDRRGAYTFNLKLDGDVLASCSNSSLTYLGTGDARAGSSQQASVETLGQREGSSGIHEEGMLNQAVTLSAGNTYTLELSLNRGQETQGYFVGLGAIELNTVPEPATASLSILGLAALMMRRRRR